MRSLLAASELVGREVASLVTRLSELALPGPQPESVGCAARRVASSRRTRYERA